MGRHNTLPFSLIRSTVTASVRRPKGGGAEPTRPPLKSATDRSRICDVDHLKQCLIKEWRCFDQNIIDRAVWQWRVRLLACVRANGATLSTNCNWCFFSYELLRRLFHIGNFRFWVPFLKQLLLRNYAVDFVEVCNVYVGKIIIKAAKRILILIKYAVVIVIWIFASLFLEHSVVGLGNSVSILSIYFASATYLLYKRATAHTNRLDSISVTETNCKCI